LTTVDFNWGVYFRSYLFILQLTIFFEESFFSTRRAFYFRVYIIWNSQSHINISCTDYFILVKYLWISFEFFISFEFLRHAFLVSNWNIMQLHTHREILLNKPEIRLYLIRFRKDFSVCTYGLYFPNGISTWYLVPSFLFCLFSYLSFSRYNYYTRDSLSIFFCLLETYSVIFLIIFFYFQIYVLNMFIFYVLHMFIFYVLNMFIFYVLHMFIFYVLNMFIYPPKHIHNYVGKMFIYFPIHIYLRNVCSYSSYVRHWKVVLYF